MPEIKDVPIVMVLFKLLAYGRTYEWSLDDQNLLDRFGYQYDKVWVSAQAPSARRSSAI